MYTAVIMLVIGYFSITLINYFTDKKIHNYQDLYDSETKIKRNHMDRFNCLKLIKICKMEEYENSNIENDYMRKYLYKTKDLQINGILSYIPDLTGNIMLYVIYKIGATYVSLEI